MRLRKGFDRGACLKSRSSAFHPAKIGAAIRKFREDLGITQDDFADKIEMHRSYYGEIERGKWNLTLRTITRVANGLGVKMWEIFRAADL